MENEEVFLQFIGRAGRRKNKPPAPLITDNQNPVGAEIKPQENKEMISYSDGSFRQRPNGMLEYRFYNETNKIQSVYGYSKQDCWEKRSAFLTGKKIPKTKKPDLFGWWIDKWYSTYKAGKIGEAHAETMRMHIDKKIKPKLGDIPITKLDGLTIQEFFNEYNSMPNTQKKLKAIIFPCLEKARRLGKIKVNPADDIELQEHDAEHYACLSYDAQKLVLENVLDKYRFIVKFMMCTGIRREKAFTLDVSAINWEANRITIVKKQKKGKNQTYSVPFLPELFDGYAVPESGNLFGDASINAFSCHIKRIYKKFNIEGNIHSFRHTFVSTLYNVGSPIKKIQTWAGHSRLDMTSDVYLHLVKNGDSPIKEYLTKLNATYEM